MKYLVSNDTTYFYMDKEPRAPQKAGSTKYPCYYDL